VTLVVVPTYPRTRPLLLSFSAFALESPPFRCACRLGSNAAPRWRERPQDQASEPIASTLEVLSLRSLGLGTDEHAALRVQASAGKLSQPTLLGSAQGFGPREVKTKGYLGSHLVDVLPARSRRPAGTPREVRPRNRHPPIDDEVLVLSRRRQRVPYVRNSIKDIGALSPRRWLTLMIRV
jgi:hypothetical protein